MSVNGFTPTQERMLRALGDGLPHSYKSLIDCLCDELGGPANVRVHISSIRKKIRPRGHDIVWELVNGVTHYRYVRLLASAVDGRS